MAGSKKREFCAPHAKGGMVDVYNKRCGFPGCTKGPSYGVAGSKKREFCAQHATEGMVNVCSRQVPCVPIALAERMPVPLGGRGGPTGSIFRL